MQNVCEFLPQQVLLKWMLVSKRFYRDYLPRIFTALYIFEPKLFRLFCHSSCIEIFSPTSLLWERNYLYPASGDFDQEYFKGMNPDIETLSKITQLTNNRFLLTGGQRSYASLVPYLYEVDRSTLLLSLDSGTFAEKPLMTYGRVYHSVAVVCQFVYVIGGMDPWNDGPVTSMERYDTIAEKWATISEDFDQYA